MAQENQKELAELRAKNRELLKAVDWATAKVLLATNSDRIFEEARETRKRFGLSPEIGE